MQHSRSDTWWDRNTAVGENLMEYAFRSTHFCISGNVVWPPGEAQPARLMLVAKGNQPVVEMTLVFSVCLAAPHSSQFITFTSLYDYVALQVLSCVARKIELLQLKQLEGERGGGVVITYVATLGFCLGTRVRLLSCSTSRWCHTRRNFLDRNTQNAGLMCAEHGSHTPQPCVHEC